MDALAPFLNACGECWVFATVHELVDRSRRTPKTLAEIRIDDQPVGQLTPKMSGELLPVVNYLAARGQKTGVRAIVKGNTLKAEVVLYAMKASELPATWFDQSSASARAGETVDGKGTTDGTVAQRSPGLADRTPEAPVSQWGTQNLPPANWYPDPQRLARLRYWDGTNWTQHTAP
jgi:collagen type III alpha